MNLSHITKTCYFFFFDGLVTSYHGFILNFNFESIYKSWISRYTSGIKSHFAFGRSYSLWSYCHFFLLSILCYFFIGLSKTCGKTCFGKSSAVRLEAIDQKNKDLKQTIKNNNLAWKISGN